MNAVVETALSNAVVVMVLAAVLAIVGRVCRKPALMHCLWVVVLIKLITPPVFPISISLTHSGESAVVVRSQASPAKVEPSEAAGGSRSVGDVSITKKMSMETIEDVGEAIGPADYDGPHSEWKFADGGRVPEPAPEASATPETATTVLGRRATAEPHIQWR